MYKCLVNIDTLSKINIADDYMFSYHCKYIFLEENMEALYEGGT